MCDQTVLPNRCWWVTTQRVGWTEVITWNSCVGRIKLSEGQSDWKDEVAEEKWRFHLKNVAPWQDWGSQPDTRWSYIHKVSHRQSFHIRQMFQNCVSSSAEAQMKQVGWRAGNSVAGQAKWVQQMKADFPSKLRKKPVEFCCILLHARKVRSDVGIKKRHSFDV